MGVRVDVGAGLGIGEGCVVRGVRSSRGINRLRFIFNLVYINHTLNIYPIYNIVLALLTLIYVFYL